MSAEKSELNVQAGGDEGLWVQFIAIERLLDNPYQSRVMREEDLEELAQTIGSQGFQGVLVARPDVREAGMYQITAGHRRREAARRAGLRELPVVVQMLTNVEMAVLAATENLQRADLSPLEEGRLFDVMMKQVGMTQMEVADAIKKDRGYVRNRLRLAHAPEDVQAFVEAKPDSLRAVVYLLEIEKEADRAPIIEQLLQKTLKTDDVPGCVAKLKRSKEKSRVRDVKEVQPHRQEEKVEADWSEPQRPDHRLRSDWETSLPGGQVQDEVVQPGLTVLQRRMETLQMVQRTLGEYQAMVQETVMPITEGERELLERIEMQLRRLAWR